MSTTSTIMQAALATYVIAAFPDSPALLAGYYDPTAMKITPPSQMSPTSTDWLLYNVVARVLSARPLDSDFTTTLTNAEAKQLWNDILTRLAKDAARIVLLNINLTAYIATLP